MTDKTVNYTAEQTAELVERYKDGETIDGLAQSFGRTARSIIAKLSREGVYKSKTAEKATDGKLTKLQMLREIEKAHNLDEGTLDSLEKGMVSAVKTLHGLLMMQVE